MKICVAQTKPIKGNIQLNIENHVKFIEHAVSNKADLVVFSELSLTCYEPTIANELAIDKNDNRLDVFQKISNANRITIGVGVPTKSNNGIYISMILFQPQKEKTVYSKKYLHSDEEPYFVSGENFPILKINDTNIAFAICYEISVNKHIEEANKSRADIYIASVAKFESGIDKSIERLSEIAKNYFIPVLMSNCVGECDGQNCVGKTSVWNSQGQLVDQLNNSNEGLIIFDTDSEICLSKILN